MRHIGDRRMLIVLDNCEHLLDPCADLIGDRAARRLPVGDVADHQSRTDKACLAN